MPSHFTATSTVSSPADHSTPLISDTLATLRDCLSQEPVNENAIRAAVAAYVGPPHPNQGSRAVMLMVRLTGISWNCGDFSATHNSHHLRQKAGPMAPVAVAIFDHLTVASAPPTPLVPATPVALDVYEHIPYPTLAQPRPQLLSPRPPIAPATLGLSRTSNGSGEGVGTSENDRQMAYLLQRQEEQEHQENVTLVARLAREYGQEHDQLRPLYEDVLATLSPEEIEANRAYFAGPRG